MSSHNLSKAPEYPPKTDLEWTQNLIDGWLAVENPEKSKVQLDLLSDILTVLIKDHKTFSKIDDTNELLKTIQKLLTKAPIRDIEDSEFNRLFQVANTDKFLKQHQNTVMEFFHLSPFNADEIMKSPFLSQLVTYLLKKGLMK